jgi:uncharacterized Fe-S cluster protein YjdI
MSSEARFDSPAREYAADGIVVEWRPALCYHSRNCIEALPAVFDPNRRPWVQADAASVDEVEAAVAQCPSGALRSRRPDRRVEAVGPTEVTVTRNGPLILRGDRVSDATTLTLAPRLQSKLMLLERVPREVSL